MAVKRTGNQQSQASAEQNNNTTSQQAGTDQRQSQVQGQSARRGFNSQSTLRSQMGRSFHTNSGNDVVASFVKMADFIMDRAGITDQITFQRLDNARHNMHFSCVSMIKLEEVGGDKYAVSYTYILEGSNQSPGVEHRNYHGKPVDVVLTAMDAWDEKVFGHVVNEFTNRFGRDVKLINAGATTVPREFDLSVDNAEAFEQLLRNGDDAIEAVMEVEFPESSKHFDIKTVLDRSVNRTTAAFNYSQVDDVSVTGLPVRTDIGLQIGKQDLSASREQNSFQHQSSSKLMEASAFVDLVYAPDNTPVGYGQQKPTQVFVPRVVITRVAPANDGTLTPETLLLSLATMAMVGDNYAWASVFNDFNSELHNIGAIGLRMPNPQDPNQPIGRIDTSKNSFGQQDLFDLIQTAIRPVPAFSIDCEDVGPDSWLTGMLVAAANGSGTAQQRIVEAANRLTSGIFARYYDGGEIVSNAEQNRIFLGTFKDEKGVTRDLREIDSLAMLNLLGDNDINAVNTYDMTNLPTQAIELRLAQRYQILRNVTNSNLNIRGYADRLTFSDKFLDALVHSVAEAGLAVEQSGLESIIGQKQFEGNPFIGQYAGAGGAMNNLAFQGNNNFSGGFQRRAYSHWG